MLTADILPDADSFKQGVRQIRRALLRVVVPIIQPYFSDCDIVISLRQGKKPRVEIIDKDFNEVGATVN